MTQIIDACFFNDLNMYCLNKMGDMGMYQNQENYDDYNFLVNFVSSLRDKVSKTQLQTTGLAAGRVSYHGGPYGINEPAIDKNGLFGCGAFTQYVKMNRVFEDAIWDSFNTIEVSVVPAPDGTLTARKVSGTGHTVQSLTGVSNGYIKSIWARTVSGTGKVHLLGHNSVAAGLFDLTETWKQFVLPVNLSETAGGYFYAVDFRGDSELNDVLLWQAQCTDTPYLMLDIENKTTNASAIPENFSDADQGYKFPIIKDTPDLNNASDWESVDGVDLVINGGFDTDSGWSKGSFWTISGGAAHCDGLQAGNVSLSQLNLFDDPYNKVFECTYTVTNYVAGNVTLVPGGYVSGTSRNSNGTFVERLFINSELSNNTLYIQGDSAFVGSIDNVSIKEVQPNQSWLDCKQNLWDALEGALGTDLIQLPHEVGYINTESVIEELVPNNDETRTTQWIPVNPSERYYIESAGQRCRVQFKTSGGVISYSEESYIYDADYPIIITTAADTAYMRIYFTSTGDVAISVKQISPAQGKLTVKWRPMFSYTDIPSNTYNLSILDVTGGDFSSKVLAFDNFSGNGCIVTDDGPTAITQPVPFIKDTEYTVTLQCGPHPGYADALKMQLTITDGATTWQSSVVDFDGSFNPADYLSFFFGNGYPQYIKSISIEKKGWL